jgi:hypothetical protein
MCVVWSSDLDHVSTGYYALGQGVGRRGLGAFEVEDEVRVRKIWLKLDYIPSRSNHVMLDIFSTGREGETV